MKCIIISNPKYASRMEAWLDRIYVEAQEQDEPGEIGRVKGRKKSAKQDKLVIVDEAQLRGCNFKKYFSDGSKTNSVFIVPELGWEEGKGFNAGYEKAYEVLTSKLEGYCFRLFFVSFLTPDQLNNLVKADLIEYVNAFPHLQISALPNKLEKPYSNLHFGLARRLTVMQVGKLGLFQHQLASLSEKDPKDAKGEFLQIIDVLSLSGNKSTLQAMPDLRRMAEELETADQSKSLVSKLDSLISNIMDELSEDDVISKSKYNYKVLIIEDDGKYRSNLVDFFGRKFNNVHAYSDNDILDARQKIKTDLSKYDIIILDMLLRDPKNGKKWLSFNGLDLYDIICGACKGVKKKPVVRIVTAIPRNDLSLLVNEYTNLEPPVTFTKGNGWPQLQGCLNDRMDELIDECKKNDELADKFESFSMPRRGFFRSNPMVSEVIVENAEALNSAMEYASDVINGNLRLNERNKSLPSSKTINSMKEAEILTVLPNILVQRRLALRYAMSHNGRVDADEYNRYLVANGIDNRIIVFGKEKQYFQTLLGFEYKTDDSDNTFILKLDNLFEEEENYVGNFSEVDNAVIFTKGLNTFLNKWVNRIIDNLSQEKYSLLRTFYCNSKYEFISSLFLDDKIVQRKYRGIDTSNYLSFFLENLLIVRSASTEVEIIEQIQDLFMEYDVNLDEEGENSKSVNSMREHFPEVYGLWKAIVSA